MPILVNATVLSNFAAVERLDLVRALWPVVYLAHSVYEELQAGWEEGYDFLAGLDAHVFPFHPVGWLRLVTLEGEEELALYRACPIKLHHGEAMSLAIAAHRGWLFLTDDRAARRYGVRIGVPVAGTVGILVQLVNRHVLDLDSANRLLRAMITQARYRSPVTDLRLLIAEKDSRPPPDG